MERGPREGKWRLKSLVSFGLPQDLAPSILQVLLYLDSWIILSKILCKISILQELPFHEIRYRMTGKTYTRDSCKSTKWVSGMSFYSKTEEYIEKKSCWLRYSILVNWAKILKVLSNKAPTNIVWNNDTLHLITCNSCRNPRWK